MTGCSTKLLSGPAWTAARPEICAGLNLEPDPRQALERLGAQLDSAYRQTAERLPENVALQIAELAGADRPDLSKLEALDEPEQLSTLRATTTAMLPARVAFSEVLLEVCRWTGFADAFTHLSEGRARAEDLHVSICAVLLAEACNISLAEVANPGVPALSPNRLSWVSQNYVRAETIAAANELLLDVYRRIPLVRALGDGHIATVDGMRFRVPVRSIHTGPNPRYFARGRGVTWLNYLTDQFAGLHAIVVPGTLRDSLMILDGLLELAPPGDGGPTMIITDQASYSDQIFGLFWLLGYQFSPRPAGLPDQRFWRIDRHADYGPLDGLARHRINADLIVRAVGGHPARRRLAVHRHRPRLRAAARPARRRTPQPPRARDRRARPGRQDAAPARLDRQRAATAARPASGSTATKAATPSPGSSSTATKASCASPTATAKKTSSARSASRSTRSCSGTPNTSTTPSPSCAPPATRSPTRTSERLSPLQHEHIKMLGHFPFTLPHELADGQRRRLRELGQAA